MVVLCTSGAGAEQGARAPRARLQISFCERSEQPSLYEKPRAKGAGLHGEGGIRTLDTSFPICRFSKPVP